MLDQVQVARILDILGNRNRRRIIDLLRQKPCFVTEISDRLMLSPKAVIEHLQIMEREEILSFRMDERRRKYYYLANDIDVMIRLLKREQIQSVTRNESNRLRSALFQLRRMIEMREELAENLRNTEQEIDRQIRDITTLARGTLDNPLQTDILISLAHCDLTLDDLCELTEAPRNAVSDNLEILKEKHIIEDAGGTYRLRDTHAEF
jgi:ArsR family transcriptional regulator